MLHAPVERIAVTRAPVPRLGTHGRIGALDGLRGVAILLVMGSHYFARWAPPQHDVSLYPYGSTFADIPLFAHGQLGVALFFLISGFVIRLTLERSSGWAAFALRRWARLFPAMLVCSLATFAFAQASGLWVFRPRRALDLLPGLTFVHPVLWQALFGLELMAMDWAYWSLFVEVIFYAQAALLWFGAGVGRRTASLASCVLGISLAGRVLLAAGVEGPARVLVDYAMLPPFLPWMAAGIAAFELRAETGRRLASLALGSSVACLVWDGASAGVGEAIARLLVLALFLDSVLGGWGGALLCGAVLRRIGVASYPLFLLHQNVGVSLIAQVPPGWGSGAAGGIAAILVAAGMVLVSLALHRWWEEPARRAVLDCLDIRSQARRPVAQR